MSNTGAVAYGRYITSVAGYQNAVGCVQTGYGGGISFFPAPNCGQISTQANALYGSCVCNYYSSDVAYTISSNVITNSRCRATDAATASVLLDNFCSTVTSDAAVIRGGSGNTGGQVPSPTPRTTPTSGNDNTRNSGNTLMTNDFTATATNGNGDSQNTFVNSITPTQVTSGGVPRGSSSSSASGGLHLGLSTGAWVGIGVGIAVGLGILLIAACLLLRCCCFRRPPLPNDDVVNPNRPGSIVSQRTEQTDGARRVSRLTARNMASLNSHMDQTQNSMRR